MSESYSVEAILTANVSDFVSGFQEASNQARTFVDNNKATFDSFKKVGAAATTGGAVIASGLGFAVKKAAEFESGMSAVAAISGATGDDLQLLSDKAREMGSTTSFSAIDAAKGLEYMALAGWDAEQSAASLEGVLHLAEAGALDLGRASDLVTDSMAGLGLGVDELDGYLDKVAKTASSSNTDIDALMEAFVIAGGTFERLNVPLEESSAFLGVLANRGFKGSEAGTAMNAIMSRLTQTTGPAAKALKEMGVSAYDSEGNFRGMETVMKEVELATSEMTDAEKAHALTQLAGLNHGKTFSAMLSGLGDEYDELKDGIVNSDEALLEMRNTMKDNLQGAMENLSSAFEEIAISIGTALLPVVQMMVGFIQSLADKFNNLDEKTKTIIAVVAAMAAGFLLLIGPILMLIGFVPQIIAGFGALKVVFLALTGPIGLTVAAVAGIIAVLILAYNKVEWFRDFIDATWTKIKELTSKAFEAIKKVISTIITDVVKFASGLLDKFAKFWDENGKFIMQLVKKYFGMVKSNIETVMKVIQGVFQAVWPIITGVVEVAWGLIKTIVKTSIDLVLGIIQTVMKIMQGDWKGAWETIKTTAESIMNNVIKFFKDVDLVQIGKDMIKGLIKGIGSMASAVLKSISGVVTGAIDGAKRLLGIKSPSRVFAGIGEDTGEGFVGGLQRMYGDVEKAAEGLSSAALIDAPLNSASLSNQLNSINNQARRGFENDFNNTFNIGKQPAVINVHVGSRLVASEIVEDISKLQSNDFSIRGLARGY